MSEQTEYSVGSGNVFADLDYANAEEVLLKARLAREISAVIREKHLTQAAAGGMLGLDQPKVSALVRGRLAGFSVARVLRCLTVPERDVTIVVGGKERERGQVELVHLP